MYLFSRSHNDLHHFANKAMRLREAFLLISLLSAALEAHAQIPATLNVISGVCSVSGVENLYYTPTSDASAGSSSIMVLDVPRGSSSYFGSSDSNLYLILQVGLRLAFALCTSLC